MFLTKRQQTLIIKFQVKHKMKNTAELINAKLEDIVSEDFEALKELPQKDKEAIIDVASHIKLANRLQQGFWLGNRKHKTIYLLFSKK